MFVLVVVAAAGLLYSGGFSGILFSFRPRFSSSDAFVENVVCYHFLN